jgi:hypothetical protein
LSSTAAVKVALNIVRHADCREYMGIAPLAICGTIWRELEVVV